MGYCEENLDKNEDEKKVLEQSLADLQKGMESAKENIATLTSDIAALVKGVKDLDSSVEEATETRKEENAEYKSTMAADKAAKELIGMAKNRLMKFYNPSLYVAPKKQELSAEQRIAVNMGSEAAPTTTPSGVAGTGITYFVQVSAHSHSAGDEAPPPPPETWGAYQKKEWTRRMRRLSMKPSWQIRRPSDRKTPRQSPIRRAPKLSLRRACRSREPSMEQRRRRHMQQPRRSRTCTWSVIGC